MVTSAASPDANCFRVRRRHLPLPSLAAAPPAHRCRSCPAATGAGSPSPPPPRSPSVAIKVGWIMNADRRRGKRARAEGRPPVTGPTHRPRVIIARLVAFAPDEARVGQSRLCACTAAKADRCMRRSATGCALLPYLKISLILLRV